MVMYRRNRIPGGTYFLTIALRNRSSSILVDRMDDLRKALLSVVRERPFEIVAMVVLPEHVHALWTLPPRDDDYPGRVACSKAVSCGASPRQALPSNVMPGVNIIYGNGATPPRQNSCH